MVTVSCILGSATSKERNRDHALTRRTNRKAQDQRRAFMTHSQAAQLAPMEITLAAFRQKFPTFDTTRSLDTLRATEYARLDAQQHVYLDYTDRKSTRLNSSHIP